MRWLALALLGCQGGDGKDGAPTAPDTAPRDVAATPVPTMPTVLTVTWTTPEPTTGHVVFGVDGALDRATPAETAAATSHTATLIGLPPETEVTLRVVTDGGESEELVVTTGALPVADPPVPTVSGAGNDRFTATAILSEAGNRIVLLDPQGRVTWIYDDPRGLEAFRARVARAGDGIWYLSSIAGGGPAPDSAIVKVGWDGAVIEEIPVPDLAHDFVELPDGTLAALAYETRDEVLGNAILEIAADRSITTRWTSWDCFDPVTHPGDDPEHGWTHANALDHDPDEDLYLVNLRNLGTIAAVERSTGACPWALGGTGGDVAIEGERFVHQHQFERIPGGMLVFDNDGAPGQESRVLEYTFEPDAKTARSIRDIRAEPALYSFILGDVHRTEDGDTLIVWSSPGTMDRVAADGTREWRLEVPGLIAFAQWLADPYVVE